MCALLLSLKSVTRKALLLITGVLVSIQVSANSLEDIRFAELPGERFEVMMTFTDMPPQPAGYTIERPARIVLDFPNVDSALSQKKFPLSFENGKSAIVLAAGGRARLILNLEELTTYQTRVEGNNFIVEVGSAQVSDYIEAAAGLTASVSSEKSEHEAGITNIDFRRGDEGEGKIIFTLSDSNVGIDVEESGKGVNVNFVNVWLPQELRRKLDVTDFATPVSFINSDFDGGRTTVEIHASGDYDYLAYQADNEYVVSIKPLSARELEEKKARFAFSGDKLSLNFQDIEVRSVLQLIADFTELNLVASDTVEGRITLRLENVPWDQALNLVLKTKGLDKRQVGNVLMVAPAAEIAERERQELETKKQLEELAPLRTEFIRIRYANAKEMFELFEDDEGEGTSTGSILSERGAAIVDERTNSIILTDTEEKISEFLKLVEQIDIPIRQVMIEARIVIANTDFRKEIGVDWFATGAAYHNNNQSGLFASANGNRYNQQVLISGQKEAFSADNFDDETGAWEPEFSQATLVDLGVENPAAAIALDFFTDNGALGLELSALQDSGHAEIVSQPKIITGDKELAIIESGKEIPYQEASSSGATTTSFKKAVLKLEVTPQITPDNRIIMDLKINQDSIGDVDSASDIPIIDVTQIQTRVLVGNGQTVVLGGIYQVEEVVGQTKVPFLGDLPYLGRLFRKDTRSEEKRELLIFITPKILAETLAN